METSIDVRNTKDDVTHASVIPTSYYPNWPYLQWIAPLLARAVGIRCGDAHAPPNWKSHVDTPTKSGVLSQVAESLRSRYLCRSVSSITRLRSGR